MRAQGAVQGNSGQKQWMWARKHNGDEDPQAWCGQSAEVQCLGAMATKGPGIAQEASRSWYEPSVRLARL